MEKVMKPDNTMGFISRTILVISRVITGYFWFSQLFWKLPPTFGCPPNFAVSTSFQSRTTGLCDWVGLMTIYSKFPLQAYLVKQIVVPNIAWLGWIIWLGEAAVAVSLILGLLTRLGGLLAFLQGLNLFLGVSAVPGEWVWSYVMLTVLGVLFLIIPSGHTLGVDAWLRPRLQSGADGGNGLARILLALT